MKLVIFFGHFKTGSSSLQRYLSRNALAFLKSGTLYPMVESLGMSYALATALNGQDFEEVTTSLNVSEPHNALALKLKNEEDGHGVPPYYPHLPGGMQMFTAMENQMLLLDPETVVLCSEVFALFGQTAEKKSLSRLARRFGHFDVTLVANLRRPDEYLHSWHRQRLKFGDPRLPPLSGEGLDQYAHTSHVDFAAMVLPWVRAFPEAKLILRDFEDVKAAGGSIEDFFTQTGIQRTPDMVDPGDFNPSVPAAYAEIARRALAENPGDIAREFVPFLIHQAKDLPRAADAMVEPFGAENRAKLVANFAPSNEQLGELVGRDLFFENPEDFARVRDISEVDAAREALPALKARAMDSGLHSDLKAWLAALDL